MLRSRFRKVLVVVLALAGCVMELEASTWAWNEWRKGYENFEMAERAEVEKQDQAALMMYRNALVSFQEIQEKEPQWNRSVVEARLKLCIRKIERLKERVFAQEQAERAKSMIPESPRSSPQSGTPDSAGVEQLRKEMDGYKEKLFKVLLELEEMKGSASRNAAAGDNIKALLKEKIELERELAAARQVNAAMKLKASESAGGALGEMEKQALELKTRNDALLAELNKLKKELSEHKAERDKLLQGRNLSDYNQKMITEKVTELESELKRARELVASAEGGRKKLELDSNTLGAELAKTREALERKSKDYEELGKAMDDIRKGRAATGAAEALARDNEVARAKVATLEKQLSEAFGKCDQLVAEGARLRKEKDTLDATLQTVNKAKEVYEADFRNLSDRYREQVKEKDEAKSRADNLEKQLAAQRAEMTAIAGRYDELRNARAATHGAGEAERGVYENKLSALAAEKTELTKKLSALEAEKTELSGKLSAFDNEKTEMAKKLRSMQDSYERVARENEELVTVRKELAALRETCAKLEAARGNYIKLNTEISKLKLMQIEYDKIKGLPAELKKLKDANQKLTSENGALHNQLKSLKDNAASAANTPAPAPAAKTAVPAANKPAPAPVAKTAVPAANKPAPVTNVAPAPEMSREEKMKTVSFLLQAALNSELQHDEASAVWHYRKALALAPDNLISNRRLGCLLLAKGMDSEAEGYLNKAYEANKNSPEVLYALAELSIRRKEWAKAEALLGRADVMDPKGIKGMYLRGMLLAGRGDKSEAVKELERGLEKVPESTECLYALAELLSEIDGRKAAAAEYYKRGVEAGGKRDAGLEKKLGVTLAPGVSKTGTEASDSLEFLLKSAEDSTAKQDHVAAIWFARQVVKLHPDNPDYHRMLVLNCCRGGQGADAVAAARAWLEREKDKPGQGRAWLEELAAAAPSCGDVQMLLCRYLLERFPDGKARAEQAYRAALSAGVPADPGLDAAFKSGSGK